MGTYMVYDQRWGRESKDDVREPVRETRDVGEAIKAAKKCRGEGRIQLVVDGQRRREFTRQRFNKADLAWAQKRARELGTKVPSKLDPYVGLQIYDERHDPTGSRSTSVSMNRSTRTKKKYTRRKTTRKKTVRK